VPPGARITVPSAPTTSSCVGVASVRICIAARVSRVATHAVGSAAASPIRLGAVADRPGSSWDAIAPPKPKAPTKPAMLGRESAASAPGWPPPPWVRKWNGRWMCRCPMWT
jgi:hypothetical protein